MSKNIQQIYIANPATSVAATDLFYLGRSPYNTSDDFAILWSNILASIPQNVTWIDEVSGTVAATANTGYTSDDAAALVTYTLPASSAVGDWLEINGKGSGLWSIAQGAGQQIHVDGASTTSGAGGSLSSVGQYDNVRLRCLTANLIWTVVSQQSTGLTVV
jgi:hypothetical protein